jgi:predicted transposase YdaD
MKDVVVTIREMSADEAERMRAEAREKQERDRLGRLGYAFEQGEKNNAMKTARKMKAMGYAADEIAKITGLTIGEIADDG